jgi:hypothetical protein
MCLAEALAASEKRVEDEHSAMLTQQQERDRYYKMLLASHSDLSTATSRAETAEAKVAELEKFPQTITEYLDSVKPEDGSIIMRVAGLVADLQAERQELQAERVKKGTALDQLAAALARGERMRECLREVHRMAHDRPTKDILPEIHKITEPYHAIAAEEGGKPVEVCVCGHGKECHHGPGSSCVAHDDITGKLCLCDKHTTPPVEVKGCPFCGVMPKPYDGDYELVHRLDCFLASSETRWIDGSSMKLKQWNHRATGMGEG